MKFAKIAAPLFLMLGLCGSAGADAYTDRSFTENLASLRGHRFVEVRGAIPAFPALTSHGFAQSVAVGWEDWLSDGNVQADYTPAFASDVNVTIFPPISDYRFGFMAGVALDYWDRSDVKDKDTKEELEDDTVSFNFYYVGFHVDYGHWTLSDIGTSIAIYGELAGGWIVREDDYGSEKTPWFDLCPIGVQLCIEKHVGIYFELPHLGARPFLQTGVSIGF